MNVGTISGGTRSGWRKVRQAHEPWFCRCMEFARLDRVTPHPGYRGACAICKSPRPN